VQKASRTLWLRLLGVLARLVVGGVWLVAGVLKLPDPAETVRSVRAYQLLPVALVPTIGNALPIVEVVVGGCLVLGLFTRPIAVVSTLMQLAFIIGISSAWARGLQIECGCFGSSGDQVTNATAAYPWDIARDIGLMLLSAYLVWRPRTPYSLDALLFPADDEVDGDDGATDAHHPAPPPRRKVH
jgi:uncharacterized membrane protein YphA (DoxX/SURF4 family)